MRTAATVALGLALASCGRAGTTATASYPGVGVYISVRRETGGPSGTALRRLVLHRPKESPVTFELPPEPAGPLRLNLYGQPTLRVFLRDRLGVYALDVRKAQLDPVEGQACACGPGTFLGSFDEDGRGVWRFIPSREREERSVE
jgi:hypothetical protein